MKFRTPRTIGALLVAGLTIGLTAPAFAQSTDTRGSDTVTDIGIEDAKDRCIQAIDARLETLAKAQERLDEADFVTEDHASALTSIITNTQSGLRDLADQIEESEDPTEVRGLCMSIGTDYRVYLVVVPQVRLTAAADRISASEARIGELIDRFDEAVERAEEAGADVTEAVALRDRAVAQFESAWSMVDGVADSVLAVTPASFNEGPGAVALDTARETVRTSVGELKAGQETGKAAVQALKDAIAGL